MVTLFLFHINYLCGLLYIQSILKKKKLFSTLLMLMIIKIFFFDHQISKGCLKDHVTHYENCKILFRGH